MAMRMRGSLVVLAVMAAIGGGQAAAAEVERFGSYISGTGGSSSAVGKGDLDTDEASPFGSRFRYELDDGIVGSGAAGIYSGPLRGEFEIAFHKNDVSSLTSDIAPESYASGDLTAVSFMLNGYYDLRIVDRVSVFAGGGVGVAAIDLDASAILPDGGRYKLDADSAAVCFQFLAGVDVEVARRVHAVLGYRIWLPLDADVDVSSRTGGSSVSTQAHADDMGLPAIQSIHVGLRIDL